VNLSLPGNLAWQRRSAITVVGYRTPDGDVEYMEMDVTLKEDDPDERFLAFEVRGST
jgi:hypothetical protein